MRRVLKERLRHAEENIEALLDTKQSSTMVEWQNPYNNQVTMSEYAKTLSMSTESNIVKLVVAMNNFEIKPNVITMVQQTVQFVGLQDEDPNAHS